VAEKTADFAITPSESVISYNTWPDGSKPKVQGIAACLQDSTSAIVTLKDSGLDRPNKLDGKRYASYGARYEGRIVQTMIKHDGGKGDYQELALPMLGIWNSLVKKEAEATWVFLGWEGVEAKMKGIALNTFKLEDYGVKYGYSPLLVTHPDTLSSKPDMVRAFLSATAQGFEFAAAHPEVAAEQFLSAVSKAYASCPLPEPLDKDMVKEAQVFTASHYLNSDGRWGVMQPKVWDDFLDWLCANGLLTTKVQSRASASDKSTSLDGLRQGDVGEPIPREAISSKSLFTNDFLPKS